MVGCASEVVVEETEAPYEPPDPKDYAPDESMEGDPGPGYVDPFAHLSDEQRTERARGLFMAAEAHSKKGEWQDAMSKYEEAYYLVPAKHGFAFRVGNAAYQAGDCAKAMQYFTHFAAHGDEEKHADQLAAAEAFVASGCE